MKRILFILILCNICICYSQNYFEGKRLYCKSDSPRAMELFNTGIETLYLNKSLDKKYLKMTSDVFFKAYQADSTFCDALFFTGYTLRLLNDKNALACYYLADSLASNKSIEFKTNLAAEALRFGNDASLKIARKKYNEIKQYFPDSPEGYYGFAITSPIYGDVEKGLENVDIAIKKYELQDIPLKDDVHFLKGVLLALNKRYDEGLEKLQKCYSGFKNDENFKTYYSLCLLKVSQTKNDEKMKQKAFKIYDKIKNKEDIPKDVAALLVF